MIPLRLVRNDKRLIGTLTITGNQPAPLVRAMAERRKNGDILLVSRDVSHIFRVRKAIINAFAMGGMFCLAAGIALGLAMSARQMRRVRAIRRVTQRISQGDLNQRLPTGGRDEIDMLSHLVNRMLDEIERLIAEVKGTCDSIAHDLRTPLAHVIVLLGNMVQRAEFLNDRPMLDLIARARSDTDRLLERFRAFLLPTRSSDNVQVERVPEDPPGNRPGSGRPSGGCWN